MGRYKQRRDRGAGSAQGQNITTRTKFTQAEYSHERRDTIYKMGGNKRAGKPHVVRPSPLKQEVNARPISTIPLAQPTELAPTSGLVRDPMFWKRFSVAIQMAEVTDEESGKASVKSGSTTTTEIKGSRNDWLNQQRKEKRRCRVVCLSITLLVAIIIAAGAVCGWYFTHHTI